MARTLWRAGILLGLLSLAGCDDTPSKMEQKTVLEGKTMGTSWRVSIPATPLRRRKY